MSSAPTHKMTPDELARLMDGGPLYEYVDGELLEKPIALRSYYVLMEILRLLSEWCRQSGRGNVFPEPPIRCFAEDPMKMRQPDAAYFSAERLDKTDPDDAFFQIAPDLAIEVRSPTNSAQEIDRKRVDYLNAGVRQVWIVNPDVRLFKIHRPGKPTDELKEGDTIVGDGDLLPGFRCEVKKFFDTIPKKT